MYTEMCAAFDIGRDTPPQVTNMLRWMVDGDGKEPDVPGNGALFEAPRWRTMLRSDGLHVAGGIHAKLVRSVIDGAWRVDVRANLKNYDNEIEKFLAWLSPHMVLSHAWQYIGTTRYEQDPLPTLVIVQREPRRIHLRALNGKIMAELNEHEVAR